MGYIPEYWETVWPVSITFYQSWESEVVPVNWKLENVFPAFSKIRKEEPDNYRPVWLVKFWRRLFHDLFERQCNNWWMPKYVPEGKVLLNQLNSFYDWVICLVDQGKSIDVVDLGFNKGFDAVSQSNLLDKMFSTRASPKYSGWTIV